MGSTPASRTSRAWRCGLVPRSTSTPRNTRSSIGRLDGELLPLIGRLNAIRRDNPALQEFSNVTFLDAANDRLIAYAKHSGRNTLVTVVNTDPHHAQEAT